MSKENPDEVSFEELSIAENQELPEDPPNVEGGPQEDFGEVIVEGDDKVVELPETDAELHDSEAGDVPEPTQSAGELPPEEEEQ